jgi:pimeloyl-ACP methyl ester carboxylesterase
MSKIEVNGINFHYWQTGEGPDIVMLHGLAGNLAVWHLRMVPRLRQNYRVTTYDLRGHGRTDAPPTGYTTRDMADDLVALMDALEIEKPLLVGHSFGADISLHTALVYPERADRLMLIEVNVPALVSLRKEDGWEGWRYWAETIEKYSGIKVPREKWTDIGYMVKMSAEVPIVYGPARGLPRKKDSVERLLYKTSVMEDYEVVGEMTLENLPSIPHPKLLIYDAASPYMHSYELLVDLLTNCEPILLPPSEHGHFSPLEQPDLLVERIESFYPAEHPAISRKEGALRDDG